MKVDESLGRQATIAEAEPAPGVAGDARDPLRIDPGRLPALPIIGQLPAAVRVDTAPDPTQPLSAPSKETQS